DFSLHFYENRKGDSFKELTEALNKVMERFSESRKDKEEALQFLQALMDHSPVGILVYDKKGDIAFSNRALTFLLGIKSIKKLDELNGVSTALYQTLNELGHEETRNFRLKREVGLHNLSIRNARFVLGGRILTLVSIQNIHTELEGKEMES